jgi:uncharacterized Zn finger protein
LLLRGRSREQIMAALRVARATRLATGPAEETPHTTRAAELLDISPDAFWRMAPAAERVQIRIAAPEVDLELLRMLGSPTFLARRTLAAQLEQVYHTVTDKAVAFAYRDRQRANGDQAADAER